MIPYGLHQGSLAVESARPPNDTNEPAPPASVLSLRRRIPHLRRFIFLALACTGLLASGVGVLALQTVTKLREQSEWVSHTHGVILELESILSSLKDAETGQRGFLLTGDPKFLQPYEHALLRLPTQQKRLGRLVADNSVQLLRFQDLSQKITLRLEILQQAIDFGRRAPETALEIVKKGQGNEVMNQIRRQVGSMMEYEQTLLKDRTDARQQSLRATFQAVGVLAMLAIIAASLSVMLLLRKDRQARSYERQLQDSEAEFRAISNAAPALVWVCDAEGLIVYLNERWYEYTGQTREQAVGFGWAATLHPSDRARVLSHWKECRASGRLYEGECRYRRRDGEYRWHSFRGLPQRNEQGGIEKWYGLSFDITDRKQAEEQLHRSDEQKSRLLYTVSHEYRTPLNGIVGMTKLLLGHVDGPLTPEQDKQVRMIETGARQLLALVDTMLDLDKMKARKLPVAARPCTVHALLESLRAAASLFPTRPDVHLVIQEPDALPDVVTDETLLSRILFNLVHNAVKYTEQGTIEISAELVPEQQAVRFVVRDSGIGIAPEDQARIFDEFTQVRSHLQQQTRGQGLGLALCKRLADMLGATITMESRVGEGSTFAVAVPCEPTTATVSVS